MTMADDPVAANLASLNEIVAEMTQALVGLGVGDQGFADLVRGTLRDHTHALGFEFQGDGGARSAGHAEAGDVSACLAAMHERASDVIRDRDVRFWGIISAMKSARDVPCLLVAVEAVLALAGQWDETAGKCDDLSEAAFEGDGHRSIALSYRAQAHADCATALREAITAALLEVANA